MIYMIVMFPRTNASNIGSEVVHCYTSYYNTLLYQLL